MSKQHIDTDYLTECLNQYNYTGTESYLTAIYHNAKVLALHNLDVILRKSCVRLSTTDREDIIEDATARLIIRIIKWRKDGRYYSLPSHVWTTATYFEVIKQLYSDHRKRWDRLNSLIESDDYTMTLLKTYDDYALAGRD